MRGGTRWSFGLTEVTFFSDMVLTFAITFAALAVPNWLKPWWLWPVIPLALVASVVLRWLQRRAHRGGVSLADDEALLDRVDHRLAETVRVQWAEQAVTRGIRRSDPLRVRWLREAQSTAVYGVSQFGQPSVRSEQVAVPAGQPEGGEVSDIVAAFRQLPHRQLVVLGEAGSGKTALLIMLVLGLLGQPEPDEPVPVLMSVASWDPSRQHLHRWMTEYLEREYVHDPDLAGQLLTGRHVMPVLDGLDELAPGLLSEAIDGINGVLAEDRPLVVASRGDDYRAAVAGGGSMLAATAVYEVQPVSIEDAESFLSSGSLPGDTRWGDVFAYLHCHLDNPLAHVLSQPLMISLARSVYAPAPTSPGELLDAERFRDEGMIEQHLLEESLVTAYADRSSALDMMKRGKIRRRWRLERARDWLAFLARQLDEVGTYDLAWWRLYQIDQVRRVRQIPIKSNVRPEAEVEFWALRLVRPQRLTIRELGPPRVPTGGLALGAAASLASWLALRWLAPQHARTPSLLFWLTIGLLCVLVSWLSDGQHSIARRLTTPADLVRSSSPRSALRADRNAALISNLGRRIGPSLLVAVFIGYLSDVSLVGIAAFLFLFLYSGKGFNRPSSAWWNFQRTRLRHAQRGDLPWALMGFLEDAHRRGVLRQFGAVYQFRHDQLQDHLALAERRRS